MQRISSFLYLLLFAFSVMQANAQPASTVALQSTDEVKQILSGIEVLEDTHRTLTIGDISKSGQFKVLDNVTPNLNVTTSAYWVRLKIRNETQLPQLILKLANSGLDSVTFYEPLDDGKFRTVTTGQSYPFSHREYLSSEFLFYVHVPPNTEEQVYLRVSSSESLILPLSIGPETKMLDADKYKDIFWGMYIGLMLAMLLYNCFVYITTKDNSYLYYIAYVVMVILTQTTLSGYAFQFLWPNNAMIAKYSAFITPVLVGIAGIEFMRHFLKTKTFVPKADKVFFLFMAMYITAAVLCFSGNYSAGQNAIDMTAGPVSIYMLVLAAIIIRKGYRPAVFFFISWIVFLVGVFVFVFKNFNILPYNNFTVNMMPVGSAMEVLLLSFALADRINTLKKEKEISQAQTVEALQENERIIREQNVILEAKVTERTQELKIANEDLNKAMVELKEAESQLVESEKMASLGQLTAGIAHEINNPINFVSSNVMPLNRDVKMLIDVVETMEKIMLDEKPVAEKKKQVAAYKEDIDYDYLKIEIDQLLHGIGEGASRTAEIVKGLRVFSRLDEDDLKRTDINEGIESTLVIANNLVGAHIKIDKKYSNLPVVECYPGKLNQVFLNIISNAIYAIKKKFGENNGGVLIISTSSDEHSVFIKFADNGIGMDENTKKRLFEPFFTTKDVGEGTGLGMSIAYNTIVKHNGQINVTSEVGVGTEFTLILPLIQK
ncbi:MAG: zraS 2 [Flavipsychrobacter sp.]|jgi:signal transduction histidine kinase|nr:zraS 2 [Flavipsychrobacter sp.]